MQLKYQPDLDLKTRLKDLQPDASNAWRFFLVSYLNKVLHYKKFNFQAYPRHSPYAPIEVNGERVFGDVHIKNLYSNLLSKRIESFLQSKTDYSGNQVYLWLEFYKSEIEAAKTIVNKEENSKARGYLNYMLENKVKFKDFDFLLNKRQYKNKSINFIEYAGKKLGTDFIPLSDYQNNLKAFFINLDKLFFDKKFLLEEPIREKEIQDIIQENFDFEQYASPIIFIDYPKQLAIYKRLLKNWLLMEVEKRKREFNWQEDTIYEPYKTVFKFAEQLLDPKEKDYLIKDSPEFFQYPKHIFAGFKAYKLFMEYLPSLSSQARFTFLYRYMREEEDPAFKILLEPAAFLDWYNQVRQNQLFDINQPLYKVQTNDRLQGYKMIKKIIQEIYPNV